VAGTIAGDPSSLAVSGATEGFVSSVDASSGQVTYSTRLAGANGQAAPSAIAVGATGASALDLMGLPQGAINAPTSDLIVANTGIKAGDSFYLRTSPGGVQTSITITATDTLTTLADKLNMALGASATATVFPSGSGGKLQITPSSTDGYIELDTQADTGASSALAALTGATSASSGDVLSALGLQPGVIRKVKTVQNGLTDPTQLRSYGLYLPPSLSIGTAAGLAAASTALSTAMASVRQAYQDLANPPTLASEAQAKAQSSAGAVPAYLTAQIANYQAGLSRLMGGG
jgi:hypothetical protein